MHHRLCEESGAREREVLGVSAQPGAAQRASGLTASPTGLSVFTVIVEDIWSLHLN